MNKDTHPEKFEANHLKALFKIYTCTNNECKFCTAFSSEPEKCPWCGVKMAEQKQ